MKSIKIILFLTMISLAIFQSCTDEKDCQPMFAIYVAIGDTSYDNEEDVPLAKSAELSFKNYVNILDIEYLNLNPLMQNSIQRLVEVVDPIKQYILLPPEQLIPGKYKLTIIGNQTSTSVASSRYPIVLHPDGTEYTDIYSGRDSLRFPMSNDTTILLRRTKGKLVVLCTHFPTNVARVDIRVTNLYGALDRDLAYIGTTQVTKSYIPPSPFQTSNQFDLVLAPTVENGSSKAFFTLYDETGATITLFSNINLTIKRNQISVINIIHNPDSDSWEIWITADGVWIRVHDLEIQ